MPVVVVDVLFFIGNEPPLVEFDEYRRSGESSGRAQFVAVLVQYEVPLGRSVPKRRQKPFFMVEEKPPFSLSREKERYSGTEFRVHFGISKRFDSRVFRERRRYFGIGLTERFRMLAVEVGRFERASRAECRKGGGKVRSFLREVFPNFSENRSGIGQMGSATNDVSGSFDRRNRKYRRIESRKHRRKGELKKRKPRFGALGPTEEFRRSRLCRVPEREEVTVSFLDPGLRVGHDSDRSRNESDRDDRRGEADL